MKIVNIIGGVGNQLFQYAFYYSLKTKFNEVIKLDILRFDSYELHNGYELEKVFSINENYCTLQEKNYISSGDAGLFRKIQRKLGLSNNHELIEQKNEEYKFIPRLLGNVHEATYYRGYWQSYKYFEHLESEIKSKLIFPPITEKKNLLLINTMENLNSVSIHIRRGDYINHPEFGGICGIKYYRSAIEKIENNIISPFYVIFSNDIEWCKENLKLTNAVYVDWNENEKSFRDLQLMSLCKHNIIANSSFSWWGAWLNNNSNKVVITPEQWMKSKVCNDLIPDDWLKVSIG
ncbi:alpha-1,2-fucosyltransferase [Colwellia sp. MB02u-18]|uniref:alpha-1,2-fucosyltransferase n=1 Tax=unclassified Colwellia TaxID=196834 RepID=UPI0015F57072|nr:MULTISPECIES: alpha-1,2-fucosyltransferase [unclassified Colwellia]MBA6224525.1 alpha-1,2-fucosyltransferase [Colwellia sp. MB3u-45]MBA6268163.1 alpha-1,2-fucosyltransferase [Colwellia sp. MB3u-43]MBA6322615.1 alpha-1,2-fucosyltransferase [Colwellia sp. MB02u-19]MBA6326193.1 alpha-1,2-fucosyltransferase [Colwellia sp. MB02u-18]MBA6331652.1 alpha-1,2-fucosyltransferase [Colwellia sp. MB02u-12]